MFAVFGSRSLLGLLALVTLQQSVAVALNNDAAVYLKGESIRGGLSLDAEGAEQVTTIPAEHLSSILERLSLTETRDSVNMDETHLPTADIFREPNRILTLVVDGVGLGGLREQDESTPTLDRLFHKDFVHTARIRLPTSLAYAPSLNRLTRTMVSCFAYTEASPDIKVQAASSNEALVNKLRGSLNVFRQTWAAGDEGLVKSSVESEGQWTVNTVKGKGNTGLKTDFELFTSVLASDSPAADRIHFVFGTALDSFESLSLLDSRISELLSAFRVNRDKDRTAVMVVLLGTPEIAPLTQARRVLNEQNGTSTGFEGWDFVLMLWTSISLIVVLFLLLCCVPWSSELDPMLLSSIKANEHLKEN